MVTTALVVSLTGCAGPKSTRNNASATWTPQQRAQAAWEALQTQFGNSGPAYPNIFAESLPGAQGQVQPSFVWPQGQVVRAALDLAKLTGDYTDFDRTVTSLSRYLLTKNGTTGYAPDVDPPAGDIRWWDDNGITCLVLLQASAQVGQASYLQEVENIWPFLKAGQWPGGGLLENESPSGQSIALGATASADMNAEHLYLATSATDPRQADYLSFVLANDAAVKGTLRASGGLYWDAYYPDIQQSEWKWCDGTLTNGVCSGTFWACNPNRTDLPPPQQLPPTPNVCAWAFDYNQGLMIGSDLLLYRITNDARYLQSAITTANAALDTYTLDWLWAEPSWFNAVYFVGLFQLNYYAPDPRIPASLNAYLTRAWTEGRDPNNGLFNQGGIGYYDHVGGFGSLDQAAFTIMFSLLAWPQGSLPQLY